MSQPRALSLFPYLSFEIVLHFHAGYIRTNLRRTRTFFLLDMEGLRALTPLPGPSKGSTALGIMIDNNHYLAERKASVSTIFAYFDCIRGTFINCPRIPP
jgi:hypothetical protein